MRGPSESADWCGRAAVRARGPVDRAGTPQASIAFNQQRWVHHALEALTHALQVVQPHGLTGSSQGASRGRDIAADRAERALPGADRGRPMLARAL